MYAFDYRQLLMEMVELACRSHLEALAHNADSAENAVALYYNLVAISMVEQLLEISPKRCGHLTPRHLSMPAGELYSYCYRVVTGRDARPRDCLLLNNLQQQLIAQALAQRDD